MKSIHKAQFICNSEYKWRLKSEFLCYKHRDDFSICTDYLVSIGLGFKEVEQTKNYMMLVLAVLYFEFFT